MHGIKINKLYQLLYSSLLQIRITDVDFWKRDFNDMKQRHERKMYPPRVKMTVAMRNPTCTHKVPIKFEGCEDNLPLNVDLTIPLGN